MLLLFKRAVSFGHRGAMNESSRGIHPTDAIHRNLRRGATLEAPEAKMVFLASSLLDEIDLRRTAR